MGGRGKNIRSRKWIDEALPFMPPNFTASELALHVNLDTRRVSGLLQEREDLKVIKTRSNRKRVLYTYIPSEEVPAE